MNPKREILFGHDGTAMNMFIFGNDKTMQSKVLFTFLSFSIDRMVLEKSPAS